jgi:hypothetical protein
MFPVALRLFASAEHRPSVLENMALSKISEPKI